MTSEHSTPALIVEDVMLVLLDPQTGAIAGEGLPLFHTLAGGVLIDLVLQQRIDIDGGRVHAITDKEPDDPLFHASWTQIAKKPIDVQSLISQLGPTLREPILERLVERGHLRKEPYRALGIFPTTRLAAGTTSRRINLINALRATLAENAEPDAHIAALGALLSASNSLPSLHREIPWSGTVHDRGKELERGSWGATATAEAVERTLFAIHTINLIISTSVINKKT